MDGNTLPPVERGDIFRDRRTGIEREVEAVVTHMHGRALRRPLADCIGERHSRIRVDRLLDRRLYHRIWPTWKAVRDNDAARGS